MGTGVPGSKPPSSPEGIVGNPSRVLRSLSPGPLAGVVRTGMALSVLGTAGLFVWRESWPWHRLDVTAPIVVSESFTETIDTLRHGETLSHLMARHRMLGLPLPATLSFNPRRLHTGLIFHFRQPVADSVPSRIIVRTSPEERVNFRRLASGWSAEEETIRWRAEPLRVEGAITNSLYESLDAQLGDAALPGGERVRLAWDLADVYAWEVDFTRDLRPGDRFVILVQRMVNDEGEVRLGDVLAGDLTISGRRLTAFRFENGAGRSGFYDGDGRSLRRAFLMAPLEFRRVSSRFSYSRRHPILGIVRRHEGTDFAAAPGTAVRAAADGVVLRAGWSEGYGNLVELRHRNGITTRYGHLGRFANGIRPGSRVEQGETIGFVGETGLATGPHLHYEFRVNGVARDPRSVPVDPGDPVPSGDRAAFDRERVRLAAVLDGPPLQVVIRGTE